MSEEMRLIGDARDLNTLHDYAGGLSRERRFRPKIARMRDSKAWRDLGDLKRDLLDMWMLERNRFAKEVVLEIERDRSAPLFLQTAPAVTPLRSKR